MQVKSEKKNETKIDQKYRLSFLFSLQRLKELFTNASIVKFAREDIYCSLYV